jgi:AcrR family transcriptional regulator
MSSQETTPTRRYRGVSGEDRKEERRLKLIQAGAEVIGEKGYHGSTVRAICQAAGVTERYFYESFANGEDLFCAIYQHIMNDLRSRILAASQAAAAEPEAVARAVLSVFYGYMKEHPTAARITFIEVLGVSPRVDEMYRTNTEAFATLLIIMARTLYGQHQQPPRDYNEEWLATGLVGAVVIITHRWVLENFKTPQEVIVNNAYGIFRAVVRQWLEIA